MSLIQEALKRQQEEAHKTASGTAAAPAQPPVHDTLSLKAPTVTQPQPTQMEAATKADSQQEDATSWMPKPPLQLHLKRPSKKVLLIALCSAPIVLILAGGTFWILKSMRQSSQQQQTISSSAKPAPTPPPAHAPSPAHAAAPVHKTPPAHAQPATNKTTAAAHRETPLAAKPALTNEPTQMQPDQTQTNDVKPEQPAQQEPQLQSVTTSAPPPKVALITWPLLRVTGVIGKGPKGFAEINKALVDVGQSIEGVMVISVGDQSVVLEYQGQKRTIRVGSSTH